MMRRHIVCAAALAAVATTAASGGATLATTTPVGPAGPCDSPGVDDTEIRIGLLATSTGPAGGQFTPNVDGARAYFEALNEAGGINGRNVVLVEGDDGGAPDKNLSEVRRLVESEDVFGVVQFGIGVDGGAQYLIEN